MGIRTVHVTLDDSAAMKALGVADFRRRLRRPRMYSQRETCKVKDVLEQARDRWAERVSGERQQLWAV